MVARLLNDPSLVEFIGRQFVMQAAQADNDSDDAGSAAVAAAIASTSLQMPPAGAANIENKRRSMTQTIMAGELHAVRVQPRPQHSGLSATHSDYAAPRIRHPHDLTTPRPHDAHQCSRDSSPT